MLAEAGSSENTVQHCNPMDIDNTISSARNGDEDDCQSITSDAYSTNSKNSLKKALSTISKLKKENGALNEALTKTNAMDLIMLSTKLRGSHADLVRCKQTISEMRDRIQILEERLFSALHSSQKNVTSINNNAAVLPIKVGINESDSVTRTQNEEALADIMFYKRLCTSYKKRIEVMQAEIDRFRTNKSYDSTVGSGADVTTVSDKSKAGRMVVFAATGAEQSEVTTKLMQNIKLLESSRTIDQKTIRELAIEVKRLSALVAATTAANDNSNGNVSKHPQAMVSNVGTSERIPIRERIDSVNDERDNRNLTGPREVVSTTPKINYFIWLSALAIIVGLFAVIGALP